jgi:hypothetical protein
MSPHYSVTKKKGGRIAIPHFPQASDHVFVSFLDKLDNASGLTKLVEIGRDSYNAM